MLGNVYTRQRCPVCGGPLVHDERRGGLFCQEHRQIGATANFYVKFTRGVRKSFRTYEESIRFLNGLRFRCDEGSLDIRDYAAHNPLACDKLCEEYLADKRKKNLAGQCNIERYLMAFAIYFRERSVRQVSRRDIRLFLEQLGVASKTQHNYLVYIRDFYGWLVKEEILKAADVPSFPNVDFELGWRRTVDWETQGRIIAEVKRMTYHENPRIWMGIDWLATYAVLRPGDLPKLLEGDVVDGIVMLRHPTKAKGRRRIVRLVDEHVAELASIRRRWPALPMTPLFRHHPGRHGATAGKPFGRAMFRKAWDRACANLGIEGIDLYGGTRHSTVTELAKRCGEHAAKDLTDHRTTKAFDRYCQLEGERALDMAEIVTRLKSGRRGGAELYSSTTDAPPKPAASK